MCSPRPTRAPGLLACSILLGAALLTAACELPRGTTTIPASLSVFTTGGAIRAADGKIRWSGDLGRSQAIVARTWLYQYPPILANGVLYAMRATQNESGATLSAIRASDGKTLWTFPESDVVAPGALTGNRIIMPTAQASATIPSALTLILVALRSSDGSEVWRSAPLNVVRPYTVDTPVALVSNLVIVGGRLLTLVPIGQFTTPGPRDAYSIAAWNLADGSLAWLKPLGRLFNFTSLIATGTTVTIAYTDTAGEHISGLDPLTGQSAWSTAPMPKPITMSVDIATASVVVISNWTTGTIAGVRPRDGAMLWKLDLDSGENASPYVAHAASDSTLYYRRLESCPSPDILPDLPLSERICQAHFYAVSLADGKLLWQRSAGSANHDYPASIFYGNVTLYYEYATFQASVIHATLVALDPSDGKTGWTHAEDLLDEPFATDGAIFGVGSSPNTSTGCSTGIEGLSARDGALIWKRAYTPCPGYLGAGGWIEVG